MIAAFLAAYREGVFPMADDADDDIFHFYRPKDRALIPITGLHIPKRLLRTIRQHPYRVTMDTAFETVIDHCRELHGKTWINAPIRDAFVALHRAGHAHSIECWDQDNHFAGGLYGLALGRVFCGESMVSTQTNASKIALVHLCAALWQGGFAMLDAQFRNPHLDQFGLYEIPQEEYEQAIRTLMQEPAQLSAPEREAVDAYLDYLGNGAGGR
jgi:leucyl/phenylalanyl-tRNA--protein transferase